jgi:hypothetical protein
MGDSESRTKLDELIESLPDTITQLETSIEKIDDQIDFLTNDQTGVNESMSMMTTAASAWMFSKRDSINPTYSVITSGTWGVDNLTDWGIVNSAFPPGSPSYNVYTSGQVTSAGGDIPQYRRHEDFPEAYDHINHDLGTDGTYGIADKISKLGTAKTLQQTNKTKYEGFLKAYTRNRDI